MDSINRHTTLKRMAYVDDTLMASQARPEDVAKYLEALRSSVGIVGPVRDDTKAFLSQNPGGI